MEECMIEAVNDLAEEVHEANLAIGWWDGINEKENPYIIPAKLAMVHTEVSEATEGYRKDLDDTHLPHYKMYDVEIADAIIRLLDLAGRRRSRIGQIMAEKMAYNLERADHKREAREAAGGKKF